VVTGLDLLVHQAALQFELFTSQPAPLAAMRAAGEAALGLPTQAQTPPAETPRAEAPPAERPQGRVSAAQLA
jgi:hypothetical protein